MKKAKMVMGVSILACLLVGYLIYYSQCVKINYWDVYKIEVYKHNEKILSSPSFTPNKADHVISFRGYSELKKFKSQYDKLQKHILSEEPNLDLRQPDYDIFLYAKGEKKPKVMYAYLAFVR